MFFKVKFTGMGLLATFHLIAPDVRELKSCANHYMLFFPYCTEF